MMSNESQGALPFVRKFMRGEIADHRARATSSRIAARRCDARVEDGGRHLDPLPATLPDHVP
jgi:hypothetical protein